MSVGCEHCEAANGDALGIATSPFVRLFGTDANNQLTPRQLHVVRNETDPTNTA
jgi:hypothetical protein